MALVRKDTVVQFRVASETLEGFRHWCETERQKTISEDLRDYMEFRVREARKAGLLPVAAAPVPPVGDVGAPEVSGAVESSVRGPVGQRQAEADRQVNQYGETESRKERRDRERRERKGR